MKSLIPQIFGTLLACVICSAVAQAQTYTWTGATADWATDTNWNPTGVPDSNSEQARFETAGNSTPTLGSGTTTVQRIDFAGNTNFTITGQGRTDTTLVLDPNSSVSVDFIDYTFASASTEQTFSNLKLVVSDSNSDGLTRFNMRGVSGGRAITIASNAELEIAAGNNLRLNRNTGTDPVALNINGVLTVGTNGVFAVTGGTVLNLNFASGSNLGNLRIDASTSDATVNFLASGNYGTGNARGLADDTTFNIGSSGITVSGINMTFNTNTAGMASTLGATYSSGSSTYEGNVTLATNLSGAKTNTFSVVTGGTLVLAGSIGAGNSTHLTLDKTGGGTLILSRAAGNSFSASEVNVAAGRLLATNTSNSALSTAPVTVAATAFLGGSGRVNGNVTVNGGLELGLLQANAALTLGGDLTMGLDSEIVLALGPAGARDQLVRAGTGTWSFQTDQIFKIVDSGLAVTTYSAIITGLAADPDVSGWQVAGFDPSWYSFSYSGGDVDLTFSVIPEPSVLGLLGLAFSLTVLRRLRSGSCACS